jgi:NAD(P)-dependent dehydrogenase (short-subunit alcohol dehydrogenase family)
LRAEIEGEGGDAHVLELDVTDRDSIKSAVAHAETEVGSIDILINNSGVSTTQRIQDVEEDDYDFIFDTNVKGAFFVAQEVGKRMLARARGAAPGTYTGGRIINIASMAGLKVLPQIGVYCMSKAAVVQMTKAMALEWGRFGINVNAICPGYIDTEINHHHWQTEQGQKLVQMLPRKRVGQPQDLDGLIVLLASGQSHFINGAVIARRWLWGRTTAVMAPLNADGHSGRAGGRCALGPGVCGAAHGAGLFVGGSDGRALCWPLG